MSESKKLGKDQVRRALKALKGLAPDAWKHADALDDHISALEAELARLKPSGQVEEDMASVRNAIAATRRTMPVLCALSRLAALAQRTQGAEAREFKVMEQLGSAQDRARDAEEGQ